MLGAFNTHSHAGSSPPLPVQAFVELALRVLEMLGAACLAAGNYQEASIVPGEGELGMGTGSGERPHAQVGAWAGWGGGVWVGA